MSSKKSTHYSIFFSRANFPDIKKLINWFEFTSLQSSLIFALHTYWIPVQSFSFLACFFPYKPFKIHCIKGQKSSKGSLISKRFIQISTLSNFSSIFSSKFLEANQSSGFKFKFSTQANHKPDRNLDEKWMKNPIIWMFG